jgi:hypothetical protein
MDPISSIGSPMQIAVGAIRKSVNNLSQDAHVVANSTDVMSRETMTALIDAKQQVLYTRAAARMISAADEMVSSLLDVKA